MTWHAVREVCYRQLALNDSVVQQIRKSAQSESIPPYRVLLVEDNPLNQSLVIRQLRQLELSCDLAEHGQQALEMLVQHPYDLVLCDCQMPVMDGYEFTRRVRAYEDDEERLLVIAMTASVLPEQAERCFAAGMDDLLGKPVLLDDLRKMLQKWHVLPSAKLLDLTLMGNLFGRGELLWQTLRRFGDELEQALALQAVDDDELADWVHRQAGTVSMMMVPGVAEQAWQLEEKVRQQGGEACLKELTAFRDVLTQLLEECEGAGVQ